MLSQIYQTSILQHNRAPCGYREHLPGGCQVRGFNPLCGDEIVLGTEPAVDHTHLHQLWFSGESCAICTASASLMCQQLQDIKLSRAAQLAHELQHCLQRDQALTAPELSAMAIFAELRQLPNRKSCATLPWITLLDLLDQLRAGRQSEPAAMTATRHDQAGSAT